MTDLFDFKKRYPDHPGFTNETTSRKAAEKVAPKAGTQRADILAYIRSRPDGATPDECSDALDMLVTSARPRCTELRLSGFLVEAGERINGNGNPSIIYRIAPEGTEPEARGNKSQRERAAIVAFLRATAGDHAETAASLATAIERGDHLQ